MLQQTLKITNHNWFPKLVFKITTEIRVLKKFPKIPKLFTEIASKLVRKAT